MNPFNFANRARLSQYRITDPGDGAKLLLKKQFGIVLIETGATGETNTLADPVRAGLQALLVLNQDGGGDRVITFESAYNIAGDTVLTLGTEGEHSHLFSMKINGALVWRVIAGTGVSNPVGQMLLLPGAAANGALLLGGGTTLAPNTTSTPNTNFLEFRTENSATSGDNRGVYLRHALTGNGTGGGETLRALTSVGANLGTAHGAHISLAYAAVAGGSETSGLGCAIRGTLHIPDIAAWAPTGTVYAGLLELYNDGAASDPAGLTELAVLCLSNSGHATGKADVDTDAAVIAINGFTPAADLTKAITTASLNELGTPNAVGIRITIDGVPYRLIAVPDADWN